MAALNKSSPESKLQLELDTEAEQFEIKMSLTRLLHKTNIFDSLPPSLIKNYIHRVIVNILSRIDRSNLTKADHEKIREIENILRHSTMFQPSNKERRNNQHPSSVKLLSMESLGNNLPSKLNSQVNILGSRMGAMLNKSSNLRYPNKHRSRSRNGNGTRSRSRSGSRGR